MWETWHIFFVHQLHLKILREKKKTSYKIEQKDTALRMISKNFLKIMNQSLEKYSLLGLLVVNPGFRFFDVGNLSL